jgi:hypothetical protein
VGSRQRDGEVSYRGFALFIGRQECLPHRFSSENTDSISGAPMKKRIALLAVAVTALLVSTGCGKEKSGYHSLSSQGAIKKINKDDKK